MVYGTRTTGAENDIEQATAIARQMVTHRAAARAVCGQRVDPAVVTNGVAASVP